MLGEAFFAKTNFNDHFNLNIRNLKHYHLKTTVIQSNPLNLCLHVVNSQLWLIFSSQQKTIFISSVKQIKLYFNIQMFKMHDKCICIPITFNNQLKACLSNKKYIINIQTRPTQSIFFIENPIC